MCQQTNLPVTGGDKYVNGVHLMLFKFGLFVLLLLGVSWVLNDGLATIHLILLQFMRKHSGDWLTFERIGHLLNGICHLGIGLARLNKSEGNLGGVMGSEQYFGLSTLDFVTLGGAHHNAVSSQSHETVNVGAEVAAVKENSGRLESGN